MHITILDTNKLFGIGIKYFLEASFHQARVDYTYSYGQVVNKLETARVSLLLMEIGTAKDNGLRILKRIRIEYSHLPILVLSEYPSDYYGPLVIRAGGCGFIEKDSDPEQLLSAIGCVLKGKRYISPELADRLARGLFVDSEKAPHKKLSTREFQIFRRIALGQSITGIAHSLDLSVKTIDTHRARIFAKMAMDKREDLARYAFEHGLIPSRRLGEKGSIISSSNSFSFKQA